jgi:4-phytase/acid phosphatase
VLPGGALVFELRRRPDHQFVVRLSYVAQSFDQMRNLTPLSLEIPPAIAPIYVPGVSGAADNFAAPLVQFADYVTARLDSRFVIASPN